MVLVYSLILMGVLIALASMAVDYGRTQVAKTQLQAAADAAARAAVQQLPDQNAARTVR
jgi:Flp pilus assembly protein TadG